MAALIDLYNALDTIREECKRHSGCITCPFYKDTEHYDCGIRLAPRNWEFDMPTIYLFK